MHIFSPTIVNELRADYNFIRVDATPQEPVLDSEVGITRANDRTSHQPRPHHFNEQQPAADSVRAEA